MSRQILVERFFETLISGNRAAARQVMQEAASDEGLSPAELVCDLFWPTYETLSRLFKADQLSTLSHHMASRLLRVLVDQNALKLPQAPSRNRRVFCVCGPGDSDELGAQMACDLLEAAGFEVAFAGGGIANDEILGQVNEHQPDVLLMFASAPQDLPHIRQLIDTLHQIGACPGMQIAVGGGVFNRAEGLAEEIGADLWATGPMEMVGELITSPAKRAGSGQRTVGRNRKARSAA